MTDRKRIVIELDVEDCGEDALSETTDAIDNLLDNGAVQELVEEAAAVRGVDLKIMASRVQLGTIEEE
jgi:hypothetical protein